MFKRILRRRKVIGCTHVIRKVILVDRQYDEAMDNDDIEDPPTLIYVDYCSVCGEVVAKGFYEPERIGLLPPGQSCQHDVEEFERIAKIRAEDVTMLHKPK